MCLCFFSLYCIYFHLLFRFCVYIMDYCFCYTTALVPLFILPQICGSLWFLMPMCDLKPRELDSAEGPRGPGLAVLVSPWPEILRTDQICIIAYK